VTHQHDNRTVARTAFRCRQLSQFFHQQRVVRGIVGVGAGETGAVYAGRAVERVDLDAGIVGQRRQAGQMSGMTRLDDRIFDEGGSGFRYLWYTELGLRMQFIPEIGEYHR